MSLALIGLLFAITSLVAAQPTGSDSANTGAPVSIPGGRQAENIVVITIDAPINTMMARSVIRRIGDAEQANADAIVIELDTPGGEVGAVSDICRAIKTSSIGNSVAWVNPNAYSGGAIVALACREIVVAPGAAMGDAFVIQFSAIPVVGGVMPLGDAERQKISAPVLLEVIDSARRNGYDEKLVQGMVLPGAELWHIENIDSGERLFIDRAEHIRLFGEPDPLEPTRLVAAPGDDGAGGAEGPPAPGMPAEAAPADSDPSDADETDPAAYVPAVTGLAPEVVDEISDGLEVASTRPHFTEADQGKWVKLEKLTNGRGPVTLTTDMMLHYEVASTTVTTDEQLKSHFGATTMTRLNRSWSERMVLLLTSLPVRGLLLIAFLVGLFMELVSPGTLIGGLVAAGAITLLLVPPLLTNMASWWEIAAIGTGLLFIAMELVVLPGFGVFGVTGMLLLFGGIVGTFVGAGQAIPGSGPQDSGLLGGVVTVLLSVTVSGVIMTAIGRNLTSFPLFNRLVLKNAAPEEGSTDGLLASMVNAAPGLAIGDVGRTVTPLRPVGRAMFGDDVHDVTAELTYVDDEVEVRVIAVDEFRTLVEPVETPAADAPETSDPSETV